MATIDPSDIGALQVHIDASNTEQETTSGGTLTGYADLGVNALAWAPNSGRAPVITTVNGNRGYNFTGSKNLVVTSSALRTLDEFTLVAIISPTIKYLTPTPTGRTYGTLFSLGRTDLGQVIWGNTSSLVSGATSNVSHWEGTQRKASGTSIAPFGWMEDESFMHIQSVGASGNVFYRGNKQVTIDLNSAIAITDGDFSPNHLGITNDTIMIGGILLNSGGTVGANGSFVLHELLGYAKYLTQADVELLNAYAAQKWGIGSHRGCAVFGFNGQSNAVGKGLISEAPTSYQEPQTDAFTWVSIYLDFHTTATSLSSAGEFGVDVPIVHGAPNVLKKPAVLVKTAVNATALGDYWLPPSGTGIVAFDAKYDSAITNLHGHGLVPDEYIYMFMGCESDMLTEAFANAVKANLTTLREYMADDNAMGVDMTMIVFTPPDTNQTYTDTVLQLIADFGLANTVDVIIIPTAGLATSDGIHWNAATLTTISERALAALAIIPRNALSKYYPIGANGRLVTTQLAPEFYANGLPYNNGELCIMHNTVAPDSVSGGWPYDEGRIAVEVNGTVASVQNGLPLTSAGRIVINTASNIDGTQNGLPFANGGIAG